jgi:hypothetical protein
VILVYYTLVENHGFNLEMSWSIVNYTVSLNARASVFVVVNAIWFVLHRYPDTGEDFIAEACPVCREICNCKACLRLDVPLKVSSFSPSHVS